MPWFDIFWDFSPGGNVEHLAEHDVTVDEAEEVLQNPVSRERSRSSGRWVAFGKTSSGRHLAVVYEELDGVTLFPITAYEL